MQPMKYVSASNLLCMAAGMDDPHIVPLGNGDYGMKTKPRDSLMPADVLREFRDKLPALAAKHGSNVADATLMVNVERIDYQNPRKVRVTGAFRRNGYDVFKASAVYRPGYELKFE